MLNREIIIVDLFGQYSVFALMYIVFVYIYRLIGKNTFANTFANLRSFIIRSGMFSVEIDIICICVQKLKKTLNFWK